MPMLQSQILMRSSRPQLVTGGGVGEGGGISTVSERVADLAASQHIPQVHGPILPSPD